MRDQRSFRQTVSLLLALAALSAGFAGPAQAADTQGLPLPPGDILFGPIFRSDGSFVPSITDGAGANTYLLIGPPTEPFTPSALTEVVRTSAPTQYVRFFTTGVTNPAGGFIVGSNEVRGLTAAQIRDRLALPFMPDSLTIALVPAGACMIVGKAGPILRHFPANPPNIPAPGPWGHGGVIQERLIGGYAGSGCSSSFTDFVNAQPIGAAALSYRPLAGSGNAGAVARALDRAKPPALFSDMDGIYNNLDLINFGDPAPLRSALVQLDGEIYADVSSVEIAAGELFLGVLHSQMRSGHRWSDDGGPSDAAATATGTWRPWISGMGGSGGISGNGNSHDLNFDFGGVAAGTEYRFDPALVAGIAAGYARSGFGTNGISGNGNLDSFYLGVYASHTAGPWYFDGALGYGHDDGSLSRAIVFPGVSRVVSGGLGANDFLSSGEVGYRMPSSGPVTVTPFAAFQATVAGQDRLTETGAGAIDLRVAGFTPSTARSILGGELSYDLPVGLVAPLELAARAGWAHDYADTGRSATARFVGAPDAGFTVVGARAPRDSAAIGVSIKLVAAPVDLFVRYDASVAAGATIHSATASLRYAF